MSNEREQGGELGDTGNTITNTVVVVRGRRGWNQGYCQWCIMEV